MTVSSQEPDFLIEFPLSAMANLSGRLYGKFHQHLYARFVRAASATLDVIGDKWTLLIIHRILFKCLAPSLSAVMAHIRSEGAMFQDGEKSTSPDS